MARIVSWTIALLVVCATAALTARNAHLIVLDYYIGTLEIPLAVALLVSLCLGAGLGIVFNLLWVWRVRRDNQAVWKLYQQTLRDLEALRARTTDTKPE